MSDADRRAKSRSKSAALHRPSWKKLHFKHLLVVYKLTGGRPVLQGTEENKNPLGPVQAMGQRMTGISF